MSRMRDESGFTLVELILTMAILMAVLGATLDTLDNFVGRTKVNERQNESQDKARFTMDRLAREVRNLASPTNAAVNSIDKATDYDFVFKTVAQAKRRVRYCLNSDTSEFWIQTQSFSVNDVDPGLPSTATCPATGGWTTQRIASQHVVNRRDGLDRNVFTYVGLVGTDTSKVTSVRGDLYVDVNPGKSPKETAVSTGDFLRNQNQKPLLPDFSLIQSPPGSRTFLLNGSDAVDPEGRTLDYFWYRGTGSTEDLPSCLTDATQTGGGFTCIGRGLTYQYSFPASLAGSSETVTLKVVDPGDLTAILQKNTPVLP